MRTPPQVELAMASGSSSGQQAPLGKSRHHHSCVASDCVDHAAHLISVRPKVQAEVRVERHTEAGVGGGVKQRQSGRTTGEMPSMMPVR